MRSLLTLILIVLLSLPPASAQTPVQPPKDFENSFRATMEVIKELGLIEDTAKIKRLNDIGYRVAQRAAPEMTHFSFRIVKMEEPNAFALPGGFIFITSGMMDLELTDDELAALLGHEIIHVKNEHSRKMSKRQLLMSLLYQALVVGIAFGLKEEGGVNPATGVPNRSAKSEILQGSTAFGLVFQELLLRGFSRDLELESDEQGMVAAARAGFSPKGTSGLFEKMRRRIYEAPGYGYWRTHPYLDDRSDVARTLSSTLEPAKNPADATDYRLHTQQTFLNLLSRFKEEEERKALRRMALSANSTGKTAQDLRWWFIHDAESQESRKEPFFRDYGKLIKLYEENIQELKNDSTAEELLKKLQQNLPALQKEKDSVRPVYEELLGKQMFETDMLQRFISNFPDSPRLSEVQFRLAENYRILKRSAEAVDLYLTVLKTEADTEWKSKSRQSLMQILPVLQDLSSCYKVAIQSNDPELDKPARERMVVITKSFDSLQNGYEFRRNYPSSAYEKPVLAQMTKLADDVLQQAKMYQAVGEYQKALDQYNKILRYCSDLPVADQVKESIVDFQELG